MKKTLIIAAMAALSSTAGLMAQSTSTNLTSIAFSYPTNIPPAVVQAEIFNGAKDIAQKQVFRATLAELEGMNANLSQFDGGDVATARQIVSASIRQAKTLAAINAIMAQLPAPPTNGLMIYTD